MSQNLRLAMVSRPHPHFSIVEQCVLLKVPRSTLYYRPKPISDENLALIDIHSAAPTSKGPEERVMDQLL
jgi:hypothetical protein